MKRFLVERHGFCYFHVYDDSGLEPRLVAVVNYNDPEHGLIDEDYLPVTRETKVLREQKALVGIVRAVVAKALDNDISDRMVFNLVMSEDDYEKQGAYGNYSM
jgi:hypothetical protein